MLLISHVPPSCLSKRNMLSLSIHTSALCWSWLYSSPVNQNRVFLSSFLLVEYSNHLSFWGFFSNTFFFLYENLNLESGKWNPCFRSLRGQKTSLQWKWFRFDFSAQEFLHRSFLLSLFNRFATWRFLVFDNCNDKLIRDLAVNSACPHFEEPCFWRGH